MKLERSVKALGKQAQEAARRRRDSRLLATYSLFIGIAGALRIKRTAMRATHELCMSCETFAKRDDGADEPRFGR